MSIHINEVCFYRGFAMKEYIEDRVKRIADYILEYEATVRQAAKVFCISKSTVHTVVTKTSGFCGW